MENANPSAHACDNVPETQTQTHLNGRRFVLFLYVTIVVIAGVFGFVLGEVVDMGAAPRLFFLIALPPTGVGFAVYGVGTIAVVLGVPLSLVAALSRRAGE
jgi:hypothetical protein